MLSSARIGVVLGAGGAVGRAYHAGVLAALDDVCGLDARGAEIIVGTSAGSIDGAMLRGGLAPKDLLARVTGRRLSSEGSALLDGIPRWTAPIPDPAPARWRPASATRLRSAWRRPWAASPGSLFAAVVPAGRHSTLSIEEGVEPLHRDGWPAHTLWINAVRLDDGARVVFGRDPGQRPRVALAVAASCAIPGYFTPVSIAGHRYVDGGVHSPSNLDLVAGLGLDLVIVSSPMTARTSALRVSPDGAFRAACRVLLQRETARVRRKGSRVVTFEPDSEHIAIMGPVSAAMDGSRLRAVARHTFEAAAQQLRRSNEITDVLDNLSA